MREKEQSLYYQPYSWSCNCLLLWTPQKKDRHKEWDRQNGVSLPTCRSSFSPRATRTTHLGTDTAVLIEGCAKTHPCTHTTLSKVSLFNSLPLTHIIPHWKLHCISVKEEAGYWASHKSLSHLKSPTLTHLSVTEVAATELLRVAHAASLTHRPPLHFNGLKLNTNDSQSRDV